MWSAGQLEEVELTKVLIVAAACLVLGSPAVSAQQNNWGQEVKACNETACYPGGTSRGDYVRAQAQDDDGPGYASEIHQLANPGKADPKGSKF